ncbi:hypothetical protein ZTR_10161 [Talaromyces verruculosus]|nr:hypothetical protein ZTR_10161 [Talaromyces verruculosus]
MLPNFNWLLGLGLLGVASTAHTVQLSKHAQDLFDESMFFQDMIYDSNAHYLRFFYYPLAAGVHETRSSVWRTVGLLQRNHGDDAAEAAKILELVIADQEKDTSKQWYGDYTVYPEQPTVGGPAYDPSIYNSWDPNWRGFISTTLIIVYEEYRDLLPTHVQDLILESIYNSTVGDTYRVGGVDDDNLYPAYTNPWLMRTVANAWTGLKMNDSNMTYWGDKWAEEFLDLYNVNNTISEYNSPTYVGVSLYALAIAAKYMTNITNVPVIAQHSEQIIRDIWEVESLLWNPMMRNFAGPWDRTYGYDMNNYLAIISLWIWSFIGKDHVYNNPNPIGTMTHADDLEIGPLVAVLADFQKKLIPESVLNRFRTSHFVGEHTYHGQTYAPPVDYEPRNVTTWVSANITIGTESFNQTALGGSREDTNAFNPAVVQWLRSDGSVGYLTWYSTEKAMQAEVAPYALNLTYPEGNKTSVFTFALSSNPLGAKRDIYTLDAIDGLKIEVGGTVNPEPVVSFCGILGGTCPIIHDFEFWNITFVMPANSSEIPSIHFDFSLE